MRMTPLDVQSHQFATRFRGFDPDEVTAFLRIVSEDYEGLVRETDSQADRILRLEARIEELSAQESLLKETLISAQSMTEEMARTAEREAELRLAEVEIRAEKILDASHRRAARLAQDIREMRALRTRLAEALRSAAETHMALLDTLEADPEQANPLVRGLEEGTVAFLKADSLSSRKASAASAAAAHAAPAAEAASVPPSVPTSVPASESGEDEQESTAPQSVEDATGA